MTKLPQRSVMYQKKPGVVSLLSVMFFIVLVAVLSLGFLRLSIDEQGQTINDDLARSALSAARSGTEIAKNTLLECRRQGPTSPPCIALENATACPGLAVGANRQIGATEFQQTATCILVDRETPSIVGRTTTTANGDFYPLRTTASGPQIGRGSTVTIKWHAPSEDQDGPANPSAAPSNAALNPEYGDWPAAAPGVMRLTLLVFMPHNSAGSNETVATMYIRPSTSGGVSVIGNKFQNVTADCSAANTDYICQKSIRLDYLPQPLPPGSVVYAHIATEYRSAHYELTMVDQTGGSVLFNDVQPVVDSTGMTSNAVRRLKSNVSYGDTGYYSRDALQAGAGICKEMFISGISQRSTITCP